MNETKKTRFEREVEVGGERIRVEAFPLIGTNIWVAYAWKEFTESLLECPYATLTLEGGKRWGKVGTERFESDLPVGRERSAACDAHYKARKAVAEEAIRATDLPVKVEVA